MQGLRSFLSLLSCLPSPLLRTVPSLPDAISHFDTSNSRTARHTHTARQSESQTEVETGSECGTDNKTESLTGNEIDEETVSHSD